MHLAYFSPLGPQRSGIADYSEELLPHLAAGAELTLFVEGFRPSDVGLTERFEVRDYRRDPQALASLDEFDAAVYHMGNDHRYHAGIFDAMRAHPGVVVFHDFALQDFFLGLAPVVAHLEPRGQFRVRRTEALDEERHVGAGRREVRQQLLAVIRNPRALRAERAEIGEAHKTVGSRQTAVGSTIRATVVERFEQ